MVGKAIHIPHGHRDGCDGTTVHHGIKLFRMVEVARSDNRNFLIKHLAVELKSFNHLWRIDIWGSILFQHVSALGGEHGPHMPHVSGFNRYPVFIGQSSFESFTCCIVVIPGLDALPVNTCLLTKLGIIVNHSSTYMEAYTVVVTVLGVDVHSGLNDIVKFRLYNIIKRNQLDIALEEVSVFTQLDIHEIRCSYP